MIGDRLSILCGWSVAIIAVACSPAVRDVVPESRDVRGAEVDASVPPPSDGYAYVARRPHGAVGLVGSHFMSADDARRLVDRLADDLEACATRLEQRGNLASGALQLVAVSGSRGTADVTDIRFAPGGPVAANALECIVAPLRASPFPGPTSSGSPALAIEATWSPGRSPKLDAGRVL